MFERVPFLGQVGIMVVLAAGIVAIAYWVWPNLSDQKADISRLQTELAQKEVRIGEGRAIEQRLPEFEREIEGLQRKLGDVQTILPTTPETGGLLRWIKNLSDQSNLGLKSFNPKPLRPVEFYKEFPIEMRVLGGYHDLGIFLDRVSKYSRIINVDNLQITANRKGDKTIKASFTATTFVYDEVPPSQQKGVQ